MSVSRYIPLLAYCLFAAGLMSCDDSGVTTTVTIEPTPIVPTPVVSSDISFAGATGAINLDGTQITISWNAATGTFVRYRVYEVQADGSLSTIASLPSSITSYTATGLTVGTLHSYIVRTVDAANATDGNTVVVSAMTYAGISSTSGIGQTSATLKFAACNIADSVNIYCSLRGGAYALTATVAATQTSASLTGLQSGASYTCKALAVSQLGFEDGNTATKTFQTVPTHTANYKGPILVQAFGEAGDASWTPYTGQPKARQVRITWKPFTGANASTLYKLVRVAKDGVIDTTVTNACTAATNSSCVVQCPASAITGTVISDDSANLIGTAPKTCTDNNVAASPTQYDYYIAQVINGWTEESPTAANGGDSAYRITVPIPPHDMVLVHRDSANYEMCNLMGKSDMDPTHHQRCAYTGLGAVPTNSNPGNPALNLDPGYYDFGYNFFVDRWVAGCNWSPSAATTNGTGKCGAGRTNGDCFGNVNPDASLGVDGNVYYDWSGGYCWVNVAQTWRQMNETSLTSSQRLQAYTNTPSTTVKKPPLVYFDQNRGADICAAVTDPDYGAKRLLRRREQIVASAWPSITGEPHAVNDSEINYLEGGMNHPITHACNSNIHYGVSAVGKTFNDSGYELARSAASGPESFVIGSTSTANCISRFGAQDMAGNVLQWISDQLGTCAAATHSCAGATSLLDSGNTDLSGFMFDGLGGGTGNHGPGGGAAAVTAWQLSLGTFSSTYFSVPLGLPLVGNDSGNAVTTSNFGSVGAKFHSNYISLNTDVATGVPARGAYVGGHWSYGSYNGRFTLMVGNIPTTADSGIGIRCGLPAE
ncbi:hypothetical protein WDW37_16230 [Bdellovibrionota bacterium FG-1]